MRYMPPMLSLRMRLYSSSPQRGPSVAPASPAVTRSSRWSKGQGGLTSRHPSLSTLALEARYEVRLLASLHAVQDGLLLPR